MATKTEEERVREEQERFERGEDAGETDATAKNGHDGSLEGQALDSENDDEDDGTSQLILPGTGTALTTTVGGKKPTESYFKMKGVALSIAGNQQVQKDTEMWVAIPVAVDEIVVRNRRKDGEIVSVARVHHATAIGQPVILDRSPIAD